MSQLGAVNIRLGAIITDYQNAMRAAADSTVKFSQVANTNLALFYRMEDARQRVFQSGIGRMASDLRSIGQSVSTYLTAPMALASGAAFKMYGDMDALKRGLEAATGSVQKAGVDFALFQKVAQLPGLGLEEAVQGGARLEALGYSAQTAARYMTEFGNAIAVGGGGKAEFGSVLTQLTQMSGKSKVLAEDLKPIVNASPVIAKALQNVFGSVDSETISKKLQAVGQGPKQFIEVLVRELAKVERVQGGPKNAMENFADAVKLGSYELGKAADNAFNLTGTLDAAGNLVQRTATQFGQLDAGTQQLTLGLAAATAAIGPLTLGLGAAIKLGPTLSAGFTAIRQAATLAIGPVGAIAASVSGLAVLAYSVQRYYQDTTVAIDKNRLLGEATAQVNQQLAGETSRLNTLVEIARNEQKSKVDRLSALKELNDISPKYLGNLTLETINTDQATAAIARYTKVLQLKAKAQVFSQVAAEAQVKALKAQAEIPKIKQNPDTFDDIAAFFTTAGISSEEARKKGIQRQMDLVKAANAEANLFAQELVGINAELAKMGESSTPELKTPALDYSKIVGSGSGKVQEAMSTLQVWKQVADNLEKDIANKGTSVNVTQFGQLDAVRSKIKELEELLNPQRLKLDLPERTSQSGWITTLLDPKAAGFDNWQVQIAQMGQRMRNTLTAQQQDIAQSVQATFGDLRKSMPGFLSGLGKDMETALKGFNGTALGEQLAQQFGGLAATMKQAKESLRAAGLDAISGLTEALVGGQFGWKQAIQSILNMFADYMATVGKALLVAAPLFASTGIFAAMGTKMTLAGVGMIAGSGLVRGMGSLVAKPMAEGGILTKPTLVLAGEAGAEGFMPLKSMQPLIAGSLTEAMRRMGDFQLRLPQMPPPPVIRQPNLSFFQRADANPVPQRIEVFGRLQGQDILLSSERTTQANVYNRGRR